MSGWLTNGVPNISVITGAEQGNFDSEQAQGAAPQTGSLTLMDIVMAAKILGNSADKTTVAGSRYYVGVSLGFDALLTGVAVLVGATGGTDKWIVELHDANGNLVATSATAGTTAGTADTVQEIAFTAPYQATAGNYFLALQSNGTTATPAVYAAASLPLLTGSATGTFGTGAAITPPASYTASVGPAAKVD